MWWIVILVLIVGTAVLYFQFNPQFGGKITPELNARYEKSPQWDGKKFVNQSVTTMDMSLSTMGGLLKEQFTNRKVRSPEKPLPILPLDREKLLANPSEPKFVWYGHSVLLLQINGKNILIDPMLGPDASPIAPFDAARFSQDSLAVIDELPQLDAILMTHDHYDHLDLASIRKLKSKTNRWLVALGVGRHLERWGIATDTVTEFDWWQEADIDGIRLIFTPSRHFAGRGLTDRAKSLWGGWVFLTDSHRIYWSGDGGYDEHFKEVGKRFGPFDWGFMECGQYNHRWHAIHMYPEEAVQAAIDAGVKHAVPVHWGGFALALHTWQDPIERFTAEAKRVEVGYSTPGLGEIIRMGEEPGHSGWWESLT